MNQQINMKIEDFNRLYNLPVNRLPTIPFKHRPDATMQQQLVERIKEFMKIMQDEVAEGNAIINKIEAGSDPLDVLVELADWLHDMIIYNLSEAKKFGLDSEMILGIIMASNMSKLGADGKPIIKDGKVQKGPNYWKPEPMIKQALHSELRIAQRQQDYLESLEKKSD